MGSSPACLHHVSFAGCVTLSPPSPCDRLSRLRVLWSDLTPMLPSCGPRFVAPHFPVVREQPGPPKFLCASLCACHDLRPRQVLDISSWRCPLFWLPRIVRRRHLRLSVTGLNLFRAVACPPLWPTQFPVYACVMLFTFGVPSQRQHLVRVVDYSLPDRVSHPARGTKLLLGAHDDKKIGNS